MTRAPNGRWGSGWGSDHLRTLGRGIGSLGDWLVGIPLGPRAFGKIPRAEGGPVSVSVKGFFEALWQPTW